MTTRKASVRTDYTNEEFWNLSDSEKRAAVDALITKVAKESDASAEAIRQLRSDGLSILTYCMGEHRGWDALPSVIRDELSYITEDLDQS